MPNKMKIWTNEMSKIIFVSLYDSAEEYYSLNN